MKTQYLILLAFVIGLSGATQAQRKDKATQDSLFAQQFNYVKTLVESNQFQVKIERVHPASGGDLTQFNPEGTITVDDTMTKGKLPFFGRAYSASYGKSGGIEFDNIMKERSIKVIEKKKRKTILYRFTVAGEGDIYRISIETSANATCNVNVNSNNRSHISYSGTIEGLKQEGM